MTEFNPQLNNFAAIVKEVLKFGFDDGPQVNKGRIEGWVNEGLQQLARKVDAPEFQKTKNITLSKGVFKYSLPEDFLRAEDIYYPEVLSRLRLMDLQQFDSFAHSEGGNAVVEGRPEYYTVYANELWLFPIPISSSEIVELRYYAKPPYLKNEGDIPLLNPDYWHLLVQYGVIRAFEAEDDFEAAAQHMTRWKADVDDYATDVQRRIDDRPRVVDGTWGGFGATGMRGVI